MLKHGADVFAKGRYKLTPLDIARKAKATKCIAALEEAAELAIKGVVSDEQTAYAPGFGKYARIYTREMLTVKKDGHEGYSSWQPLFGTVVLLADKENVTGPSQTNKTNYTNFSGFRVRVSTYFFEFDLFFVISSLHGLCSFRDPMKSFPILMGPGVSFFLRVKSQTHSS